MANAADKPVSTTDGSATDVNLVTLSAWGMVPNGTTTVKVTFGDQTFTNDYKNDASGSFDATLPIPTGFTGIVTAVFTSGDLPPITRTLEVTSSGIVDVTKNTTTTTAKATTTTTAKQSTTTTTAASQPTTTVKPSTTTTVKASTTSTTVKVTPITTAAPTTTTVKPSTTTTVKPSSTSTTAKPAASTTTSTTVKAAQKWEVTLNGWGFPANGDVVVTAEFGTTIKTKTFKADASGSFNGSIAVPDGYRGIVNVTAKGGDVTVQQTLKVTDDGVENVSNTASGPAAGTAMGDETGLSSPNSSTTTTVKTEVLGATIEAPASASSGSLAYTGSDTAPMVSLGFILVGAGLGLVALQGHRRRQTI